VSSTGIYQFIQAASRSRNELHGFVLLRHGKLIAEGWWSPYDKSLKHSLYSTSKSFTATAVGFAIQEKKLSLEDKVVSFFPKDLPDSISPNLAALCIQDLLTMSVGQDPDPTFQVTGKDSAWIKGFLRTPIVHRPGSQFLYNTMATYMLSAIVQHVTGKKLIDYLRPRLLEPLGITDVDWETSPEGINTGGWGLRLRTEDMAKFGQLFLQHGQWGGRQILPPGWTAQASRMHIVQHPQLPQAKKDSSDWEQGYGFQMWRCRHGAYRADGAYGQFIIVMPDQDAVLAINAETPDMQDEINLVWQYLLPAMQPGKLPEDPKQSKALLALTRGLSLSPEPAAVVHADTMTNPNHSYALQPNTAHWSSVGFHCFHDQCILSLEQDGARYALPFGFGHWIRTKTALKGPNLISSRRFNLYPFTQSWVSASCQWTGPQTLVLYLRFIESPHAEKITCHFQEGRMSMDLEKSLDFGKAKTSIEGVIMP